MSISMHLIVLLRDNINRDMRYSKFTILVMFVIYTDSFQELISQETRDPQKWPFADTSIWNTPIGTGARYVHAQLQDATDWGMTIDEDLIVMRPDADLMTILESDALWDRNKSRCISNGKFHLQAPIPADFIVSPENWDGLTPNSGLAVLMQDSVTIKQTQPFAHCDANAYATSKYSFGDVNKLVPGGEIRHVMKVNVFGKKNLYYDDVTKGYRWPAYTADAYAKNNYGAIRIPPSECRMGALLALPPWLNLDTFQLETEPAKILARGFQNFGAYIVDDTGWDVYGLVIEWGPAGRVADEFESVWGFDITSNLNTPWARDIRKIFKNLHVVDNNNPDSIGGGGAPPVSVAPPFGRQGNHYPVVAITSPPYVSLTKKGITEIKANAYDVDGEVRKVEFYANGILIGADSILPYSVLWNIEKEGVYRLVARAIDNEYLSAVSRGIEINTYVSQVPDTILYSENFTDNEAQDWHLTSTAWSLQDQELKILQENAMGSFIAFYNLESFSNHYFSLKAQPEWNNWMGAVFNLQDDQNYYLFKIHTTPAECKLVKVENGVESDLLTGSYSGGGSGSWYTVLINNRDSLTTIWINNALVFDSVSTPTFRSGKVGVYSWYQPSSFDDIIVFKDSTLSLPFIIPNQPPLVYLTEPDSGTILDDGKPYMVKVNASDPDGKITHVELFKNWEKVGTLFESPFIFNFDNAVRGEYCYFTIAYDDHGAFSVSKEGIVKVEQLENDLPTVNITYPPDSAEFIEGENLTIKVDALDTDGMISLVDIISNGELLKSDPRPLYNYDWYGIDEGLYKIVAKVYSEGEQIVISDTVLITVKKPVGLKENFNITNSVRIYPNPLHDECLFIEFDQEPHNAGLMIMSIDGKVTHERIINSKLEVIKTNNMLSKGIYFMKIRNNNEQILIKLIVL